MISLERDKMTALWLNDSLTSTFYETISNCIPGIKSHEITTLLFGDPKVIINLTGGYRLKLGDR